MDIRGRSSPRIPVLVAPGPDRSKQSFKDQCDINFIMGRYLRSGNIDWLSRHDGVFGEVPAQTFHDAMNIVAKAKEMFADLPAEVRKRFANSPEEFLKFSQASDKDGVLLNIDELRKLGLAKPAAAPPVEPVEARLAELEVDRAARLELARRAVVAPPAPPAQ